MMDLKNLLQKSTKRSTKLRKQLTYVLELLAKGYTLNEIANILGYTKQNISRIVRKYLIPLNFVRKVGYGTWEVTQFGYEFLVTNRSQQIHMGVVGKVDLLLDDKERVEVWNYGHRFLVTQDFDPEKLGLKKVPLKNGGHYYHGFLQLFGQKIYLKYKPRKQELEIRVPVVVEETVEDAKAIAINLLSKAIQKVVEKTRTALFPLGKTKAEIIVRNEQTKRIAKKFIEKFGNVETDVFAFDESKSRKIKSEFPDSEFFSFTHAKNFVENLAIENKADFIIDVLYQFTTQFKLHFSVLRKMEETLSEMQNVLKDIRNALRCDHEEK